VRYNGRARPALLWLAEYIRDNPTGIDATASVLPSDCLLDQNFPNPFNTVTHIRYRIVNPSKVTLRVFDRLGREVQTLVNSEQTPGQYMVPFNARLLSSGIYFYQIHAGSFTATKRLLLIK
jgi:hypothetical protein